MQLSKRAWALLSVFVVFTMILAACGGAPAEPAAAPATEEAAATADGAVTAGSEPEVIKKGKKEEGEAEKKK